jgi:hypothetical protein
MAMVEDSTPILFPKAPGVYRQPFPEYLADDSAVGRSEIAAFIYKSPLHARSRLARSSSTTKGTMKVGSAFHCKVLEPRRYKAEYRVSDHQHNSNALKDFCASESVTAQTVLTTKQAETVASMYESLEANEHAFYLCTRAIPEATIYAHHHETGLWLKARPDALHPDRIVDLKTTAPDHFRPLTFRDHARRYGHLTQIAFYALCARLVGFDIRCGHIVAVENDLPFDVCAYRISRIQLEAEIERVENALRGYKECLLTGVWPGVARGEELPFDPKYAERSDHDLELEAMDDMRGQLFDRDSGSDQNLSDNRKETTSI